jgi:hypothetical protein
MMFADRQCNDFLKKFVATPNQLGEVEALTFKKFLDVNEHLSAFNTRSVLTEDERIQSTSTERSRILLRARALIRYVLTDFTEDEWFLACKNSQGASLGVPFKDTSVEAKLKFPISATSRVKSLFDRYLNFDTTLKLALYNYNASTPFGSEIEVVEGSRATTVPKTAEIRRMIAIEPTGNMFFQQGLMHLMYRRMTAVGLDVQCLPTRHRQLALESSITARNATIDFSSASDCVSIELLRWLLPPRWFYVVDRVRSPRMLVNNKWVDLNMISTMGNAVTFPLETLVFWSLAQACRFHQYKTNSLFPKGWEDFNYCSVFGDDCILPSSLSDLFISITESLGFIVNNEKSFTKNEGFRESCGGDYLHGINVRPFYLKAPTSNRASALEPWLYIIANNLSKKYMSYFGVTSYIYDKALYELIFRLFRDYKLRIKLVPDYFPDDSGLKMSQDIERLSACYPMKLSRIRADKHGVINFTFCTFRYRKQIVKDPYIRYALWLKIPGTYDYFGPVDCPRPEPLRSNGGYVVAKCATGCWSVPGCQTPGAN